MASLHQEARSPFFYVHFRFQGQRYNYSCETADRDEATAIKVRVERAIRLIKDGHLSLPGEDIDLGRWIFRGGKQPPILPRPAAPSPPATPAHQTLEEIFAAFLEARQHKAKTTLAVERPRLEHWKRLLGAKTILDTMLPGQVQEAVNRRLEEPAKPSRKKPAKDEKEAQLRLAKSRANLRRSRRPPEQSAKVKPVTVEKMLRTFVDVWEWAKDFGYVSRPCPIVPADERKRRRQKWLITLPKADEEYQFMTWEECEQRVARLKPGDPRIREIWRKVYLDEVQAEELLAYVKKHATIPSLYPMLATALYAGARRGELCRCEVEDIRFTKDQLVLRQKKSSRQKGITLREVPLNEKLRPILEEWFQTHPGGRYTFAYKRVRHSRGMPEDHQIPEGMASHALTDTLAGSKWEHVHGFHVLRHTFGAICVRAGIPRDVIAKWMGHSTEAMRKLYQHLYPSDEQNWMKAFGSKPAQ